MVMHASFRSLVLATAAVCLLGAPAAEAATHFAGDQRSAAAPAAAPEAPRSELQRRLLADPRLERLYASRAQLPIWLNAAGDGLSEQGLAARRALQSAAEHGLDPARYGEAEIEAASAAGEWRSLDLLISTALLDYVSEMARGRSELRERGAGFDANATPLDEVEVVRRMAAGDVAAVLATVEPQHPQYRRLFERLAELREREATGGWPHVPDGDTLDPGTRGPRVALLRERLAATDLYAPPAGAASPEPAEPQPAGPAAPASAGAAADAAGVDDAELYDPALEQAVRAFQRRSGLVVDGRVGPNTLAALNRSVSELIEVVRANMERWRWLPRDLGERYLLVNTAGFEMQLVEQGRERLRMPVVNGEPARETPMFSAEMSYLEVNPTWTVPPTIFAEDYLPKLRRNPGYLAEQNITLYDSWSRDAQPIDPWSVDWHAVPASTRSLPFRLVQSPGPHNALGRIKFMMPNRHSIYLHDTNHRELFDRSMRALSSGCVRLERPDALAEIVLRDAPGWDMERLRAVYASGERTRISLARTWPVHVAYFTAWIDDDGVGHFYRDIYGRDGELIDQLRNSPLLLAEEPADAIGRS